MYGYAGRILRVDLSSGKNAVSPTSDYQGFLGGRGLAAKIHWDEVPPEASAYDEANCLTFGVGPLAGISGLGTSRWSVCGKSPLTSPHHFNYCNLGGRWGAELKFLGYDSLVVRGIADRLSYLVIDGANMELRPAEHLRGLGAIETREVLKNELGSSARVVAIGPAGENGVATASILADNDASGSGGLGATMGGKNLKAIAIKGGDQKVKIADPEALNELTNQFRNLRRVPLFISPYRCTIDENPMLNIGVIPGPKMKKDPCYGCLGRCPRRLYQSQDGRSGKFICDSAMFYQPYSERFYGEWNDVPFYAAKLVDTCGIDSGVINFILGWLDECLRRGILDETSTGLPLSKLGSIEFIHTLMDMISFRKGFGELLAQGVDKAAEAVGTEAVECLKHAGLFSKTGYNILYGPRLLILTGILHAMEPRTPIRQLHHISNLVNKWLAWVQNIEGVDMDVRSVRAIAREFLGSEEAADFSTYEGKALAAKMIQDREYVGESLITCDWLYPISDLQDTPDHVGDPGFEGRVLAAVTGESVDETTLDRTGERLYNLHRAIMVREGHHGRAFDRVPEHCHTEPLQWYYFNHDCLVPGKDGETISRKGSIFERDKFEMMKDEYYILRDWDVATGLQTRKALDSLGLTSIANDLEERGLLGPLSRGTHE